MDQNGMEMGRGYGYKNYKGTGPLITNHLQVRNLDRELEILRQKREAVQREQQMLNMANDCDRKRQYEHTNRNSSDMYNVWQQPPLKRANNSRQPNPWANSAPATFGPNMSKPKPANYIPSLLSKPIEPPFIPAPMKPIVHPMLRNNASQRPDRPLNVRKDFRPTNVTKRKLPPKKMNTYSLIKHRQDLVSRATGSQLAGHSKSAEDSVNLVLRENQIPSNQVTGRLELALGTIIKELRSGNAKNDKFQALISNSEHQRFLKQMVRERLRTVMLNKPIGSMADIIAQYREVYPKASDKDLVELAVNNSQKANVMTIIEAEKPEEFFKKNIDSILEKKIQEMATNLLKMYTNRRNISLGKPKVPWDTNRPVKKESILNNDQAMKVLRSLSGKYIEIEEKKVLDAYYTELIEHILEEKIPEYLPQCTDQFLKIFDLDHQFNNIKLMATAQVIKTADTNENKDDDLETDTDISDNKKSEPFDTNETKEIETIDDMSSDGIPIEANKAEENNDITLANMDVGESSSTPKTDSDEAIKPTTIPLAKNTELTETTEPTTLLATIPESPETKKSTSPSAEKSDSVKPTIPVANTIETRSVISSPVKVSTPLAKELQYYVKLIGKPNLPNRAAICDFLNKYRPSSIKKHKSINNLLVIGFTNQEDYDNILTANETVIDNITIVIKASEKIIPGKEKESTKEENETKKDTPDCNNEKNESKEEDKASKEAEQEAKDDNEMSEKTTDSSKNQSLDEEKDLIGKELDDQISDLLCTIKESDDNIDDGKKTQSLEPVKKVEDGVENEKSEKAEKVIKVPMTNVKESGRATPVRSSSRLGNLTPSTIRTRRSSRLMQE